MLSKWPWISRCGDYWQQVELRTDGACRIMMMTMMIIVIIKGRLHHYQLVTMMLVERAVIDNAGIKRRLCPHQLGKFCRVRLYGIVRRQPLCIAMDSTKPP